MTDVVVHHGALDSRRGVDWTGIEQGVARVGLGIEEGLDTALNSVIRWHGTIGAGPAYEVGADPSASCMS